VTAHHPMYDYLKKTYKPPYYAREIMIPVYKDGNQVYDPPSLKQIKKNAEEELESLEAETKRFINPHIYKVSLSDRLHQIKKRLLTEHQLNRTNEK
jgi:nicotinate phosphoribosyltransferase